MNETASRATPGLDYQLDTVAVEGGQLAVARWGHSGPVVLAIHGITGSHREFLALAEALGPNVQLLAADLRGRGRSRDISGPWGMGAHAADMVAVLEHFGCPRADVVLGHSMGGFVAAVMGAEYPEACGALLMVDGGLPIIPALPIFRLPFGDRLVEKLVHKIIGPALTRLDMSFPSIDAYRDYWRDHPALQNDWSRYVEDYVDYDLVGDEPELRPSTNKAALLQDVRTQLIENLVPDSLRRLKGPVRFLRAPRGLMNDKALYKVQRLTKAGRKVAGFSSTDIPDTNHYTILMSTRGAEAVATELRRLCSGR